LNKLLTYTTAWSSQLSLLPSAKWKTSSSLWLKAQCGWLEMRPICLQNHGFNRH